MHRMRAVQSGCGARVSLGATIAWGGSGGLIPPSVPLAPLSPAGFEPSRPLSRHAPLRAPAGTSRRGASPDNRSSGRAWRVPFLALLLHLVADVAGQVREGGRRDWRDLLGADRLRPADRHSARGHFQRHLCRQVVGGQILDDGRHARGEGVEGRLGDAEAGTVHDQGALRGASTSLPQIFRASGWSLAAVKRANAARLDEGLLEIWETCVPTAALSPGRMPSRKFAAKFA